MTIKRRNRFSFTDSSTICKAICNSCYQNNIETKLVVYDKDPDHFMICPYCNNIVSKKSMRHESLTQPLGYKGGFGPVVFEALVRSKTRRIKHREDNEVFNVEDYPMTPDGTVDKDLVHYSSQGIVLSVNDENIDSARVELMTSLI